jgi:hypothetical protein
MKRVWRGALQRCSTRHTRRAKEAFMARRRDRAQDQERIGSPERPARCWLPVCRPPAPAASSTVVPAKLFFAGFFQIVV